MELLDINQIDKKLARKIAVYAFNRNKSINDIKAVQFLGLYDKKNVVEETKFRNYYLKANAYVTAKTIDDVLNVTKAAAETEEKQEPTPSDAKQLTQGITNITKGEIYVANKKKDEDHVCYVPTKYYKINQKMLRGNVEGLLAYSSVRKEWFLYNGSLSRQRFVLEYDMNDVEKEKIKRKFQTFEDLFQKLFKVKIDSDNNDNFDVNEARRANKKLIQNGMKEIKPTFWNCNGRFDLDLKNKNYIDMISVCGGNIFSFGATVTLLSYNNYLTYGFVISNVINSILQFFGQIISPSSGFGFNINNLPLGYIPEIVNALYEPAKDTGKALFETLSKSVAQQATGLSVEKIMDGVDGAIQNSVAIAEGTGNVVGTVAIRGPVAILKKVVSTLVKVITQVIPFVAEKIMEFISLFFSQISGAGTAGGTGAAGGAFAGAKAFAWSSLNTIINTFDFVSAHPFTRPVVNVASLLYALKTNPFIRTVFQEISCMFSELIRMSFKLVMEPLSLPRKMVKFVRRLRAKEYLPLDANDTVWQDAMQFLEKEENFKKSISQYPRLILLPKQNKTIVYSENSKRISTVSPIVNNPESSIPFIYVIGTARQNDKDYYYYYDYNYKKGSVFEIYKSRQNVKINGVRKAIFSFEYPREKGGSYCEVKINNFAVSGIPWWAYLFGSSLSTIFSVQLTYKILISWGVLQPGWQGIVDYRNYVIATVFKFPNFFEVLQRSDTWEEKANIISNLVGNIIKFFQGSFLTTLGLKGLLSKKTDEVKGAVKDAENLFSNLGVTGVFTKSLQFSGILGVLKTTITAVETVRDTIVKLFAWIFSEMSCMFGRLSYNFFMFILNKDQELWFPLIEKNLNEYFQRLIQK